MYVIAWCLGLGVQLRLTRSPPALIPPTRHDLAPPDTPWTIYGIHRQPMDGLCMRWHFNVSGNNSVEFREEYFEFFGQSRQTAKNEEGRKRTRPIMSKVGKSELVGLVDNALKKLAPSEMLLCFYIKPRSTKNDFARHGVVATWFWVEGVYDRWERLPHVAPGGPK